MKKKSGGANRGILLIIVVFCVAIIVFASLIALTGNSTLNRQLKTHVTAGDYPNLGCGSAKTIVETNLSDNNVLYTGQYLEDPYRAYLKAKESAMEVLQFDCKETFTCNGGTSIDIEGNSTEETKTVEYACPNDYPPTTENACRPSSEQATGTALDVHLVDANGQRHPDSEYENYCTITKKPTRYENKFTYIVSCRFVGECECQKACQRNLPKCEKTGEATGPTECKGEQGKLVEGPVIGDGASTASTEQEAKNKAVENAIANAKVNLQKNCNNWNTLHAYTTLTPETPECTLGCAAGCNPLGSYKPVLGPGRKPTIDNFTCGDVIDENAIAVYNSGSSQPSFWKGTAKAVGCVGRCLMESKCQNPETVTTSTNQVPL